ncbi:HAD-IA family hydrolase [Candidatus Woesearchaeota archaeon]|jgi:HAD superfamily hydrolase (TIGR01662 family)|nr:HAD-IA family hydrolase [Candidatus Woesearchaeota archaeon]
MKYVFKAKGHKNILASHKSTLEFTKDREMSLDGDCIVGIGADFSLSRLKQLVTDHKNLRMRIKAGKHVEEIDFIANKQFSSSKELVLRFSEFSSDRTFGFRATKSARQLDRKLIERMRDPRQDIIVEIEPQVKALIFDFDNTIEDLKTGIVYAHHKLAQKLLEMYGVYAPTTVSLLNDIDSKYSLKGVGSSPMVFDRHNWFDDYFKQIGVEVAKKDIDHFVDLYWRFVLEKAKPMPHAADVLGKLKRDYKIGVMTDSDGKGRYKIERAKTSGLLRFIDAFMVSDEVGMNKPNRKFYSMMLNKLRVEAKDCVMIGDKPQVDLKLAKELGMKTVWVKYGNWAKRQGKRHFDYVDHEVTDILQLLKIVKEL